MFKIFLKYLTLWSVGAFSYGLIEIAFRGYTHISMGILGGICLILIGSIDQMLGFDVPLFIQMFISAVIITCLEFATGTIVNLWLGLNVWDYSHLPGNYKGQICLPFFFIWYFLSAIGIFVDDYTRYYIFNEKKPHYCVFRITHKVKNPL